MNQPPRNPSHQTPQPMPSGIATYARDVLGIHMTEWQQLALTDAVIAFGYAVIASSAVDDVEDQPAEQPGPIRQIVDTLTGAGKGGQEGPRPYAPTRIPSSQTPIGDSLPTGPRDA
jgi:hypothetical protein